MKRLRIAAYATLLALTALAAAACGSNHPSVTTVRNATTPVSDNVRVCRNYEKQRAWEKGLAQPTVADAIQFSGDIQVDWQNTQPHTRLSGAFSAMWHDGSASKWAAYRAASAAVLSGCEALGVKFSG